MIESGTLRPGRFMSPAISAPAAHPRYAKLTVRVALATAAEIMLGCVTVSESAGAAMREVIGQKSPANTKSATNPNLTNESAVLKRYPA